MFLKQDWCLKVTAFVVSVEFQNRGMPHAHCLFCLDRCVEGFGTPEFVDQLITAEIPDRPSEETKDTPEGIQQQRYYDLVKQLYIHDCTEKSMCMIDGSCNKRFPKPFCDTTIVDRKPHLSASHNLFLHYSGPLSTVPKTSTTSNRRC